MFKKLFTVLFTIVLFAALTNAQERTFMRPDGKFYKSKNSPTSKEVMKVKQRGEDVRTVTKSLTKVPTNVNGVIDTLGYNDGSFNTNFGTFGQDWYMQWFVAPADLTIKGFAFQSTDDAGAVTDGAKFEGKIVKVNLTQEQLTGLGEVLQGYYPATGNGYNDATAFPDNADRTGDWVAVNSSMPDPFGNDIWSDAGFGAPITPNPSGSGEYQWIQTNVLFEPDVLGGEIFAIVYKHTGTLPDQTSTHRLGVLAGGAAPFYGWKFYAQYRNSSTPPLDYGWWSRNYTWDFLVEVDITGNTPPGFDSFTSLPSGLDLGPYTVDATITDENAGNPGNAGVASAWLYWSTDDGATWDSVAMSGSTPNFSGQIPAQTAGTTVQYYLGATDLDGLSSISLTKSFYIFAPTAGVTTLIVFNGWTGVSGYPQSYYFGSGDWPNSYSTLSFSRDRWAYGPLVADVVNNYTNIIEICTNGPNDINNDVIKAWLDADAGHNYMLAGDEWIGSQTSWVDRTYAAGDFQFDVLGINADHNDINYAETGDQELPSVVYPQMGTALGGPTYDLYVKVTTDSSWTLPMTYDPTYEVGADNWLDGVDFEGDVEVFMKGLAVDGTTEYSIGGNRTLTAGNKIAFFAYDPLSLSSDTQNGNEYFWYSFMNTAPQVETLVWFGAVTNIAPFDNLMPSKFDLTQNYPNPFNPSTTINFSLPEASNVVLKVYDILGKEVAVLLNGDQAAGNYRINFDASGLASGLYFYTLKAGNFTSTKKMMLMK